MPADAFLFQPPHNSKQHADVFLPAGAIAAAGLVQGSFSVVPRHPEGCFGAYLAVD